MPSVPADDSTATPHSPVLDTIAPPIQQKTAPNHPKITLTGPDEANSTPSNTSNIDSLSQGDRQILDHPVPPQEATHGSSVLQKSLRAQRCSSHKSTKHFVPLDAMKSLLTRDNVMEELQHHAHIEDPAALARICRAVCIDPAIEGSMSKLFAILLLVEKSGAIMQFLTENLHDGHLPFRLDLRGNRARFYRGGTERTAIEVEAFSNWGDKDIEIFDNYQWSVLSPFFSTPSESSADKVFHYDLEKEIILPFISFDQTASRTIEQGNCSRVFQVKIHKAHHKFNLSVGQDSFFAVKKLESSDESSFHDEVDTLKRFSRTPQEHLVQLLATYKYWDQYYLIFHLADRNLRGLWKEISKPNSNRNLSLWIAEQSYGLAVGLNSIHDYQSHQVVGPHLVRPNSPSQETPYGRHSDIKPENILWFKHKDTSSNNVSGILKISDFGFAKFSSKGSRSGTLNHNFRGTPTYRPPESDLHGHCISRSVDIWTMGCLYLEFITWALEGYDATVRFCDKRLAPNEFVRGLNEDTFFIIRNERGKKKAELKPSVVEWIDHLRSLSNCTAYHHECLVYIVERLLVPNPKDRASCDQLVKKLKRLREALHGDDGVAFDTDEWPDPRRPITVRPYIWDSSSGECYDVDYDKELLISQAEGLFSSNRPTSSLVDVVGLALINEMPSVHEGLIATANEAPPQEMQPKVTPGPSNPNAATNPIGDETASQTTGTLLDLSDARDNPQMKARQLGGTRTRGLKDLLESCFCCWKRRL